MTNSLFTGTADFRLTEDKNLLFKRPKKKMQFTIDAILGNAPTTSSNEENRTKAEATPKSPLEEGQDSGRESICSMETLSDREGTKNWRIRACVLYYKVPVSVRTSSRLALV